MATTEQNIGVATSTPEVTEVTLTPITPSGDLILDKATVRAYWKWITVKVKNKKTGQVTEKQKPKFIAKVGSEDQKKWKAIEEKKDKDGNPEWNFFSENTFQKYTT